MAVTPASATKLPATGETQLEQVAMLGGVFGRPAQASRPSQPDVQYVQLGDPRVTALEEQVRTLNGKLEELNFLILQMQEQLRKQQEDNEFRFQELEGGAKPAGEKRTEATPTAPPASQSAGAAASVAPSRESAATSGGAVPPSTGSSAQASAQAPGAQPPQAGLPQNLGSIRFDANGNLIGGTTSEEPVDLLSGTVGSPAGQDTTTVAALPSTDDPEELYRNSYEFILSGDYKTAEAGFRSYIERFPDAARVPDANFWLGEALASQNRHRDAAEVFLSASREYPEAKKAADTLLKLGMSLNALKQREVACATFREVGQRYPSASDALKERVRQEIATNGC
nr:tol-pal system protein YbgF [Tianweitania sediminis]